MSDQNINFTDYHQKNAQAMSDVLLYFILCVHARHAIINIIDFAKFKLTWS